MIRDGLLICDIKFKFYVEYWFIKKKLLLKIKYYMVIK